MRAAAVAMVLCRFPFPNDRQPFVPFSFVSLSICKQPFPLLFSTVTCSALFALNLRKKGFTLIWFLCYYLSSCPWLSFCRRRSHYNPQCQLAEFLPVSLRHEPVFVSAEVTEKLMYSKCLITFINCSRTKFEAIFVNVLVFFGKILLNPFDSSSDFCAVNFFPLA